MQRAVLLFLLSFALVTIAGPAYSAESDVQQASHTAPTALPKLESSAKVVVFHQQPTQVGERVAQRVGMELDLHTVIKQAGQIASDTKTSVRTRQQRHIEVLEVSGGQARRATISYPLARQMSPENPEPDLEIAQVVENHEYFIKRQGEQLLITDTSGAIPTKKEFEIVLGSMENFGKPNPLAEFLLSRQIQVGDKLNVPLEMAAGMMGLDKLGVVQKFELRLAEVALVDDRQCALFDAKIITNGTQESPLRIEATGRVAIEIATTRTIEATLSGPVTMTLVENGVHYDAKGKVLMAVHSYYQTK